MKEICVIASASGMTPPVPFRVGAAVACELNALRENSELEVTPEDAGAFTSCIEAGDCAGVAGRVHVVTVEQSVALRMSCLYSDD